MEAIVRKFIFMILCTGFLVTGVMLSNAIAKPCVNVDKASAKELLALKGVGDKTAKAIIEYRKKMRAQATKAKKKGWNFNNWKTLLAVKGMHHKICTDNVKTVCFGSKTVPQKSCPKPEKAKAKVKAKTKAKK